MTGVVLLGQGFMGRVHSTALRMLGTLPGGEAPRLVAICGRDAHALAASRRAYGWARATTDWRELIEQPGAQLLIDTGPNDLHAEPAIAALARGMHVLCEKPLARGGAEAEAMWRAAARSGRVHACAFNYRFMPALRLARELIGSGAIGGVLAFRSRLLMRAGAEGWRAGDEGGVLLDLAVHHLDLARWLVGEPDAVAAVARDDAVGVLIRFAGGATGVVEASRAAGGHALESAVEVDGSLGTLAFDLRRLNELRHSEGSAVRTLTVTPREWWPAGHPLGWFESFVYQSRHVLGAIEARHEIAPAATFEDGYRCALVCDAVTRSLASGAFEAVHAPVAADA